jgi:serine/threonine protein kinase
MTKKRLLSRKTKKRLLSRKTKKRLLSSNNLKGGRFLDEGSFGCVITPAIPCSKNDKNLDKSVSKIIRDTNDKFYEEIKIAKILKRIDKEQKYYITFNNYCNLKRLPEDRNDIADVIYKDDEYSKYSLIDKKQKNTLDKKFCHIDMSLKPFNIIMPFAGYSLKKIFKSSNKDKNLLSKINNKFLNNVKFYFKHLLVGLYKMHSNFIVNRDIKDSNIIVNLNEPNLHLEIRYIDFGLSNFLSSKYINDYKNITIKGTVRYIPPDMFISKIIAKYPQKDKSYHMKKLNEYINDGIKISYDNIDEKISNLDEKIEVLYNKIKTLYDEDKLLYTYFGSTSNKFNGFIQKADIYALGITIFKGLYMYNNINIKNKNNLVYELLYDLLCNMIEIDPFKRYNITQCLEHPYFTNK